MRTGPRFGLGHALLSILGTQPVIQPLEARDGHGILCFNGEIYNFLELAHEEPALGASLLHHSDSEVLVEGLALHGESLLPRLNGIFALAWMDLTHREGFLARDPLGVKPLYYMQKGETLYFASETRALIHLADAAREPDPVGLYAYVRFRYPMSDRSLYQGIKMLPAGCVLRYAAGRLELRRFAVPDPVGHASASEVDAHEEIRVLLDDSVQIQTRSDRDFCTFLSGGLDSSLLSAKACRFVRRLDTFSVGFDTPSHDESAHALSVARHIGSHHHAHSLDPATFREVHAQLVQHLEEPIGVPNQVALSWLCMHLAREHRCVLSGEGADEVFGGYGKIFLLGLDWERLHGRLGVDAAGIARLQTLWPTLPERFSDFFHDRYAYVPMEEARLLLQPYLDDVHLRHAEATLREEFAEHLGELGTEPGDVIRLFQRIHLPGLLLRLDTATMAHGVEGRVPFLDHRLIAALNALPWAWKMKPNQAFQARLQEGVPGEDLSGVADCPKYILKQLALPWLPEAIVNRPKMGFPIPRHFFLDSAPPEGIHSDYGIWVHANLNQWTG